MDKYQEPFMTVSEALQAAFEVLGQLSADLPEQQRRRLEPGLKRLQQARIELRNWWETTGP